MSDDLTQHGKQDRSRINVHQAHELRDWCHKFGVSPQQLEAAVNAVGDRAVDVEQHLKGSRGSGERPGSGAERRGTSGDER